MRARFFSMLAFISILAVSCESEDQGSTLQSAVSSKNPGGQITSLQWIDSAQDYGRINEGQKLAISFRFKNVGNKPLILESVQPTCGCTVADYPKEPIPPGEEGEITGEFDSQGREGLQRKHITVVSNTNPVQQDVSFQVMVVGKKHDAQNTSF